MRLSTNQMFNSGMHNMLQSFNKLNQVNGQIGANKRVLTPADDPVAAAQTLNTKTRLDIVNQYNRNIDFANKNLDLTESVLDQTESSLMSLKDLAIQLGSDQWSNEQITASAKEAEEILKHLQGLVNTRNESGEYIFAGSQARDKAYEGNVYQGDAVEREAQVADAVFIKMLTTGDRAFENLDISKLATHDNATFDLNDPRLDPADPNHNPDLIAYPNNMLGVVQYFVDSTGNGAGAGEEPDKEAIRNAIQNLDVAFEQVSQTRSQVGSRQNTLDAIKDNNQDFAEFAEKSISELEDLDWADAIIRLESSMLSYQASMQTISKVQGLSLFNFI